MTVAARIWSDGMRGVDGSFSTAMALQQLGSSELAISRVGIGTAPIG